MDNVDGRYYLIIADMGREVHVKCKDCPKVVVKAFPALCFDADLSVITRETSKHEKKFHTERTVFTVRQAHQSGWDPLMAMSVHKQDECSGEFCVIHKPSMHHMRFWPIVFEPDLQFLAMRSCEHGMLHPDPDSLAHFLEMGSDYTVHLECGHDERPCCCIEEN